MSDHLQTHMLSKFKIVKKIGSGAYGHVWKVIDNKDNKVKALKKNFDAFNNSTDAQRTYRQIMFLMELKHPNIIKLQQVIRADNNNDIYLIFEHMDIDLFTLIRQSILEQKHKKWILYQIAKAIFYLHSAGLIHRDLKPSNILVNQSCQAKLCDFGLVRSIDDQEEDNQNILTEYIATRWYRAPEILVGSLQYTKAIDIWGFGCLIGQMFKGKPLFPGTSTINQMQRIISWTGFPKQSEIKALKANGTQLIKNLSSVKKINKKQFVPKLSQQGLDLMSKCMHFDPEKRIKIDQIMIHPYLKQFFSPKDMKSQKRKIKVSIDDNKRLSLREYRSLIYKQIKMKDTHSQRRQSVDKTLYRIRQTSSKKHQMVSVSTEQSQKIQKVSSTQIGKKLSNNVTNPYSRYSNSITIGKNETLKKKSHSINEKNSGLKHLKTMENEWNPLETKKAVNFRQQMKRTKNILTKPKRSVYEGEVKRPKQRSLIQHLSSGSTAYNYLVSNSKKKIQ